ncbi:hypothetical protein Pmani_021796 [Petrolisthes manimaculis]|uniref:Uncharacterized protein n=1 Tax=Petrolisthes manimaculis TaxID=1843537 RepID=A0AAE1U1T4_9EUCA|nr:hypothetical protein Pmani_021796 [Petrolisthes manimaculis]
MSVQEGMLRCLQRCIKHSTCKTFIIATATQECFITSFDRCTNPHKELYWIPGYNMFEVKSGAKSQLRTCYSQCQGTCEQCGRPNCDGKDCKECAHVCWHYLVHNISALVHLWPGRGMGMGYMSKCDQGWQKVWGLFNGTISNKTHIYASLLENTTLVLKLVITYQDNIERVSYFGNVSITLNSIDVGDYLGGNAGNYWDAPFKNRVPTEYPDCLLFYYPPMTTHTCTPGGTHTPGWVWVTGEAQRDKINISEISLWITDANIAEVPLAE